MNVCGENVLLWPTRPTGPTSLRGLTYHRVEKRSDVTYVAKERKVVQYSSKRQKIRGKKDEIKNYRNITLVWPNRLSFLLVLDSKVMMLMMTFIMNHDMMIMMIMMTIEGENLQLASNLSFKLPPLPPMLRPSLMFHHSA